MHIERDQSYYAFKPITENPIILDLAQCRNGLDIHLLLKEKFGLPEYYGQNWDALWDCLDGLFEDEDDILVQIHGYHPLSSEEQQYYRPMLIIFKDLEGKSSGFRFEILS